MIRVKKIKMSSDEDDETNKPVAKKQRIYFGSLEEQEKERLEKEEREHLAAEELLRAQGSETSESDSTEDDEDGEKKGKKKKKKKLKKKKEKKEEGEDSENDEGESSIDKALKSGNINVTDGETLEMAPTVSDERQKELMADFEKRKITRSITVSTDDSVVKAKLRELGHPITLFGEGPAQRRDRLRDLLSVFEQMLPGFISQVEEEVEEEKDEEMPVDIWYHEGSDLLKQARLFIAEYSLPRAQKKLALAKQNLKNIETDTAVKTQEVHRKTRSLINFCSQIGDNRPLSFCQFSPNGEILATTSWSGLCKLWSIPDGNEIRILKGHNERVGGIVFHPESTKGLSKSVVNLVSYSADGSLQLWNLESDNPLGNIVGHDQRVTSADFHPSGRFLGTSCFDKSWRLWDLEQQKEVLHQEGHSKECYKISFQNDGALAATSGYDARGLIWDLRTGRNIMALDGHLKKVLAMDFHPNGYQVATGSEDQKCMVWDLRQQGSVYTIPAHNNIVSHLKFCESTLVTASFDGLVKVWSNSSWALLKTLKGHEQKVTCVDVTNDGNYYASTSFDRTFKLWAPEFMV